MSLNFHSTEALVEASVVNDKTAITSLFHQYPLKLMIVPPANSSTSVINQTKRGHDANWVYAVTYGGGLVAGDDLTLQIKAKSNASLVLTSQASTKVYKSRTSSSSSSAPVKGPLDPTLNQKTTATNGPQSDGDDRTPLECKQTIKAVVEENGFLAIVPHAVTCFRDARYSQHQVVHLHERGNLVLVDWLTAGRMAREEAWAFHSYKTVNDVFINDQLLVREAVKLSKEDGEPSIEERMRGYNAVATILVVGPLLLSYSSSILKHIGAMPIEKSKDVALCTASPIYRKQASTLPTESPTNQMVGVMVKIAAKKTSQVADTMRQHFSPLWEDMLGGDPYNL